MEATNSLLLAGSITRAFHPVSDERRVEAGRIDPVKVAP